MCIDYFLIGVCVKYICSIILVYLFYMPIYIERICVY